MTDLYPLTPDDDVRQIKREDREYYERYGDLVWVKNGRDWVLQEEPDDEAELDRTRPSDLLSQDDWDLIHETDRHEPSRGV